MKEFWNTIGSFFTETIPSFAKTNWAVIEIVLAALVLVLLVALIVVLVVKKRQHTRSQSQIMEWVGKNTDRVKQLEKKEAEYKELNEKYINEVSERKKLEEVSAERVENVRRELTEKYDSLSQADSAIISELEKNLATAKELVADRELSLSTITKEVQEKDTKIANMTIEKDNTVLALEAEKNLVAELRHENAEVHADLDKSIKETVALQERYDGLEKDHNELVVKHNGLETAYVNLTDKHAILDKKYAEALKEIDFLKNYELENEVLLKTLRKFKEDDESSHSDMKDAISSLEKRLNTKIEASFESMVAKVISANAKASKVDFTKLESLKRSELSKLAKELGISNYATWTNEKLCAEIRKYKN